MINGLVLTHSLMSTVKTQPCIVIPAGSRIPFRSIDGSAIIMAVEMQEPPSIGKHDP